MKSRLPLLFVALTFFGGVATRGMAATYTGPAIGPSTPTLTRYNAPTANLTLVANAIQLKVKSLTTLAIIPAGLKLTNPVQVSIGYYSPAGNSRITQSYVAASGNRFLYNDKEGDGKPRAMRLDVSLLEVNPNGAPFTFSFSMNQSLDPLYRVSIGPLSFSLISACDITGDNEIQLSWLSPDRKYHQSHFRTPWGRNNIVKAFSWSAAEVSAASSFSLPALRFEEKDNGFVDFLNTASECVVSLGCPFPADAGLSSEGPLIPGKSRLIKKNLTEASNQCAGYYEYQFQSTLNFYPYL